MPHTAEVCRIHKCTASVRVLVDAGWFMDIPSFNANATFSFQRLAKLLHFRMNATWDRYLIARREEGIMQLAISLRTCFAMCPIQSALAGFACLRSVISVCHVLPCLALDIIYWQLSWSSAAFIL